MTVKQWAALCSVIGLAANLVGVILIFRYGMPYRVPVAEGAGDYITTEKADPTGLAEDARHKLIGKVGLVLICIGSALQALGSILAI